MAEDKHNDHVAQEPVESMEEQELQPVTFDEFTPPTYEEWQAEVERALKGAPFDKKMYTKTYEGITLEPIYTPKRNQEAIAKSVFPGQGDYTRGSKASGYIADTWGVAQHVENSLPAEANKDALYEIEKGATVYNIRFDKATLHNKGLNSEYEIGEGGVSLDNIADVAALTKDFDYKGHPVYMETGASAAIMLSMLAAVMENENKDVSDLHGVVAADPVGTLAHEGQLICSLEESLDEMAHTLAWAKEHAPHLRTILVSGDAYHNGGSNDVQEVAYALTTGIFYVREMLKRGFSLEDVTNHMQFTFSLGANFFMEIAKLRSIRLIWSKIMEAFGADEDHRRIYIHGRTSRFTKTVYDPYVNMLRDTTQAFSGVVGGLDSMEVSPFDMVIRKSDAFSRRISRNMQVMMQTEFELRQPVDPAGGSWYIETLSMQLNDKIWSELQVIEGKDGIVEALKAGYPQDEVEKILEARFTNLELRKDVAVGNNMYANMVEELLDTRPEDQELLAKARKETIANHKPDAKTASEKLAKVDIKADWGLFIHALIEAAKAGVTMSEMRAHISKADKESVTVKDIPMHRWTERFEAMRKRTEDYKQKTHENVKVFLANMGPIPQHKPRADFSTGFMEVAAFEVLKNNGFKTPEEAAQAAAESGADVVIICSTDKTYPELVPPVAKMVKEKMPGVKVFLAGAPAAEFKDSYIEAGVDDFIHVRANCYKILSELQKEKGMMA